MDADTVRIPVVPPCSVQSLLCSAVFRGVIGAFRQTAPASLTASNLRCLIRSRLLRHHFGTHLAPAAGLSRFKLSGILLLLDCKCKRRSDRCIPLKPHPVRRLPRPTALPAHILRDSVRFAPRDSQDVEPAHTDARFRVLPEMTGITRPGQAKEDISITYYLPPSYLFVQDLLCGGPVLRRLSVNLCCRILMLCRSLNQIPGFPTAGLLWET